MPHATDARFTKLRELGYTGSVPEMELAWLKDNLASSVSTLTDAWHAYLRGFGLTGSINDMKYVLWTFFGFVGSIDDKEYKFWTTPGLQTGPQLISNGTFTGGGAGWTPGAGVAFGGDKANFTAVAVGVGVTQVNATIKAGKTYRVAYDVSAYAAGSCRAVIVGAPSTNGISRSANGTYTQDIVALADATSFGILAVTGAFTGSIDNVSCRRVV